MTNVDRCPPAVSELLSMGLREHLPTLSESVSSDTGGLQLPVISLVFCWFPADGVSFWI